MHGFPRHAHRDRRLVQDFEDEDFCFQVQLRSIGNPIDKPYMLSRFCIDEISSKQKLRGASFADQSRKSCSASKAGNCPNTDLGVSQSSMTSSNAEHAR